MLHATCNINTETENETIVNVYDDEKDDRLICWGGYNMATGKPYIVFTPPHGIPRYSVKQERFFKVFLLAAHIHFAMSGEVVYRPEKPYDCYKTVWPREHYGFNDPQELPEFDTA